MKEGTKNIIIEAACIVFILLYIYTAASKFLDFHKFSLELHKSPLLVDYSSLVSWLVPSLEIVVAVLLVFATSRLVGLYCSLTLMILFTCYIVAILQFAEYIPCTCGGVIQQLSWRGHLMLNAALIAINVTAVALSAQQWQRAGKRMAALTITSAVFIAILFYSSYDEDSKYSSFDVTWLNAHTNVLTAVDLSVNSYYFAGVDNDQIFLGNSTVPGMVRTVSSASAKSSFTSIKKAVTPFAVNVRVKGKMFFLHNGANAKIFTGKLTDSVGQEGGIRLPPFDLLEPGGAQVFGFRYLDSLGEFSLGITSPDSGFRPRQHLLTRQLDGRFCKDGMLRFHPELKRFYYVYFYRNQFVVTDSLLNHPLRRRTIDSVRTAKIKIAETVGGDRLSSVAIPVLIVNRNCFASSDYLFIWSGIRARNETETQFKEAMRIDSYDFVGGNYLGSFHIPMAPTSRAREFQIVGKQLWILSGNEMTGYDLSNVVDELESLNLKKIFTGR